MAYGLKYSAEYITEAGGNTREVQIWEDGYTDGVVYDIYAMSEPELDWDGGDKKEAGVIGLECKFTFLTTDTFNADTLFHENPRHYKAIVIDGATTHFVGWLQGDLVKDVYTSDSDTRLFSVSATDGLGDLADIDIAATDGTTLINRESVRAFLGYALKATGLDLNMVTAVDWFDSYMSDEANSLNQVTVDPKLWIEEEKTISTKDVLDSFCKLFYARLFQRGGKWHFICLDNQIDAVIPAYEYTADGTQVFTTTTFSHRKVVDTNPVNKTQAELNDLTVWVDNKPAKSRQRPIKRLEVNYDYGPSKNEVNGDFFGGSTEGWIFHGGITHSLFSLENDIGSNGLELTGTTKINVLASPGLPEAWLTADHLTTSTRAPYDEKYATVYMTVKKYEKIELSFDYLAPQCRGLKLCISFVYKDNAGVIKTESNIYDDLSTIARDGLGSDGGWYSWDKVIGGRSIRHLLIPNLTKNAAGDEVIKSNWENYQISSTNGVSADGWVVLYLYRGINEEDENDNASVKYRNINFTRTEYGDILNNTVVVLENTDLAHGDKKAKIEIKYGEPLNSLNYSYLARLNGARTNEQWDRAGINPSTAIQALVGAMYLRQHSGYGVVLEGTLRADELFMGDTVTLSGYAGKVFLVTRLQSSTKRNFHEVTLVELFTQDFEPRYYTKSGAKLTAFFGALRSILIPIFKYTPGSGANKRQGVEDLSGGQLVDSGSTIDLIAAEFFETPEDSTLWRRVGATDEPTGLYRLPTIAFNDYGVAIDYDDNTLETVWFKARGELADLADALLLFPTNDLQNLPLAAQNGVTVWWAEQVENITNAPTGLEGECEIFITTVGKFCQVTVKNDGGECYNYTHDLGDAPAVWSGWKYSTVLDEPGIENKLIASKTVQSAKNINIWAHEDNTFSMGSVDKLPNTTVSVNGTVGGEAPSNGKHYVNWQALAELLAGLASDDDIQAIRTELLNEIANRANRSHTHPMGDVIGLFDELNRYLDKGVFTGGLPYYQAARDADGLATMVDASGVRLLIEELPPAQEDVAYSFTITGAQFVWPAGSVNREVITTSTKKVRGSLGWLNISAYDSSFGVTLTATPTDDEDTVVFIKMRWQLAATAKPQESVFPLTLSVYPSAEVITAPNAPTDFVATVISSSQINLTWTDNSSNETGFELDWSLDASTWQRLANTAANVTSYSHTGLTASTHYYYRVRAYGALQSAYEYADNTTTAIVAPPAFEEDWVDGSARLKVDSPTPVITLPTTPTIVWVQRQNATGMNIRYRNNHFTSGFMELQGREVGTETWYTMRDDGVFVLTTTTPMRVFINPIGGIGSETTFVTTASFYSGKVVEMRVRIKVGSLLSLWSDPKSE